MSVRLSLVREVKSRPKENGPTYEVDVVVSKGNVVVGHLHSLSGGEQEKIKIMFFLCMQKLIHNKLLIVDETLSTLDSDSMDSVLDKIREHMDGLVLTVNHRHGEGMYDLCLDICSE